MLLTDGPVGVTLVARLRIRATAPKIRSRFPHKRRSLHSSTGFSPWRTSHMAKALLGHVGIGSDLRLAAEVRRLRARVQELESELARVRAANQALSASVTVDDDLLRLTLSESEPALT